MDLFHKVCRRIAPMAAFLLLSGVAAARADDQPKTPAAGTPAKPAAPPKPAAEAKPPAPPKPVISAKKEGEGILGKQVYDAHGADMGLVTNVLVDHAGKPVAVVIDFGGFLGMGTRKIAIDWRLMKFHAGDKDKSLTLNLDKDQLKSAPTYKPDKPPRIVEAPAPKPPTKSEGAPAPAKPGEPAPKTAPVAPSKDNTGK